MSLLDLSRNMSGKIRLDLQQVALARTSDKALCDRQNTELSDRAWDDGCRRLAEVLARVLPKRRDAGDTGGSRLFRPK